MEKNVQVTFCCFVSSSADSRIFWNENFFRKLEMARELRTFFLHMLQ